MGVRCVGCVSCVRCGRSRGFDSHQLNCAFSFSFVLFSSFPLSSSHPLIFAYFHIAYCTFAYLHIAYFTFAYFIFAYFQKMQRTWTVCILSGRCFIEQKGVWIEPLIFWAGSVFVSYARLCYARLDSAVVELNWIGCDGLRWVSGVSIASDVAGAAGSIHINLTVLLLLLLLFLFSVFSYFLIFIFSSFHLFLFSSYHICIFVYLYICIFAHFIFHIRIFSKMQCA
jgi:hypothetical protein